MYLSNQQIEMMADASFQSFEMTASRSSAIQAASEYAQDEWGIKPRKSVVLLAYKIAMTRWEAESFKARRACQ
jgi:hypothetical protein